MPSPRERDGGISRYYPETGESREPAEGCLESDLEASAISAGNSLTGSISQTQLTR